MEDQNRSCLDCRSIRSHSVLQIVSHFVSQKAAKFGNKERVNVFFVRLVNRLDVSSGGRLLVRTAGLEPARGYPQRILSPLRLPVPPRPRGCGSSTTSLGFESTERKLHPPCGLKTLSRLKPQLMKYAPGEISALPLVIGVNLRRDGAANSSLPLVGPVGGGGRERRHGRATPLDPHPNPPQPKPHICGFRPLDNRVGGFLAVPSSHTTERT